MRFVLLVALVVGSLTCCKRNDRIEYPSEPGSNTDTSPDPWADDVDRFIKALVSDDFVTMLHCMAESVLISGAIGDLEDGPGLGWKSYDGSAVVDEYRKQSRAHPLAFQVLLQSNLIITTVGKYKSFPEGLDISAFQSDDIVLDFRYCETFTGTTRSNYDDAPVSVFRKVNGGYKIVAQLGIV